MPPSHETGRNAISDLLPVSREYQLSASFHYRAPAWAVIDGFINIAIHAGIEGGAKVGSESPERVA